MRNVVAIAIGLLTLVAGAQVADAKVAHYRSQHPLPRKIGHGFCHIEVPHVHNFEPADRRLYRQVEGQYYFVGDPAAFDYQGPRYSFYGAHPVVEAQVQVGHPIYCYLAGPHFHWYQPPPEARFEFRGGAYWYVGTYEPVFYQERPRYVVVNEVYRPMVYARPVVDVTVAPPGFQGEIVVARSGWRGRAAVGAPAVSAGVHVVAPMPPTVHVGVGVNLGGPPPPTIVEHRTVYEVRERHDRGRHKGWSKHGDRGRDDGWRGKPAPSGGWRGNAVAPAPSPSGGWRGNSAAPSPSGGWRGKPAPPASPQREKHQKKNNHEGGGWRR